MLYTPSELKSVVSALTIQSGEYADQDILEVVYDTRKIKKTKGVLFVALRGEHRTGHDFIADAYQKGVRLFLVESIPSGMQDATFIQVENTYTALKIWAVEHRKKFHIPVIGITGSNGKTVAKEWLSFLLKEDFKVYRSPRSYNSSLGVALSILGLQKEHELAIIEAGISRPNEMLDLWEMIQPSLVVLTHLGSAHDNGFDSRLDKAIEKALLCKDAHVVVYPKDQEIWGEALFSCKKKQPLTKWVTWGEKDRASYQITSIERTQKGSRIAFKYRSMEHVIRIPFSDKASIENAMTCFSVLTALERWDEEHIDKFQQLFPLENRLSIHEGIRGNTVVDDSYSHDWESLEIAFQVLNEQAGGKKKMAILSPMLDQQFEPEQVTKYALDSGVDELIWIGDSSLSNSYSSLAEFKKTAQFKELSNTCLLIKGSRSYQLDELVNAVKKQVHTTFLEINLDGIRHNLKAYRTRLNSGVKTMVMVKASGYGSGQYQVARVLESQGVDYFGVAFADEGVALRNAGVKTPIMVMNTDTEAFELAIENKLEPVVYSENSLRQLIDVAGNKKVNCHVEFNTGMNRLGFDEGDIANWVSLIPANVKVVGLFTHLASAENPNSDESNLKQIRLFDSLAQKWVDALGYQPIHHVLNSSGILRFPDNQYEMVRLGIGLYGFDPAENVNNELVTTASLFATVSQIRTVLAGEGIGYGSLSKSDQSRQIATLNIGYADGLNRVFGNGNSSVYFEGKYAPFVGSICMDMSMIDVTGIDIEEGDQVEVFGANNSIKEMADRGRTIPYEILTSISSRVNRVFVGEY